MDRELPDQPTQTLPSVHSKQPENLPEVEVAAALSRLALHYWRPDFSPSQVKLLLQDFLHDLEHYSPRDIEYACESYRRDPANKFFPTPGALLGILKRYDTSEPSLPRYVPPLQIEMARATKSVAQILRENGFDKAAERWRRGNVSHETERP